ncbi:MAG: electron transfer flavoprotein subunit alpha/FixB family protein [Phycisphaerae bacterium]|jgi:electron transfer flavoprotein alpha subunit|nr:electron transfer flavoprotein subunit alpha/FixB family protein [Phycisphaerae bacterium]
MSQDSNNTKHAGVWILAEQSGGRIGRISHELLTRGRALADKLQTDLTAMVFGCDIPDDDLQDLIVCGADRVIAMEAPQLAHFLVEPYSACAAKLLTDYRPEIVIAGATSTGRTLMPYLAIKIHAGLTADCTVLDIEPETNNLLQTRPAIGGNILATIKTPVHRPQMATVRPHSTRPAQPQDGRTGEILRLEAPPELLTSRVKRAGFTPSTDELSIQDAEVVVTAGRGVKRGENIAMISELADTLGAAVGATRDVVDRGWMSYPHQVGLSGKTVTPKLYVGVGVSGSIQHIAGMGTSDHIIAINNDPDAQIFQIAELGLVGDLFEIVPVLTQKLKKATGKGD